MKIDKKQIKPVAMQVVSGTAGIVAANYIEPEVKKTMGKYAGYSDEVFTAVGTLMTLMGKGNNQTGKVIRSFGIGVSIKGLLGLVDKYIFNKKVVNNQTGVNAPVMYALDEPVEIIDVSETKKEESKEDTPTEILLTV